MCWSMIGISAGWTKTTNKMEQNAVLWKAAKNIRLIAMDLDGSCLNSAKVVSPRTKRVIRKLIQKGVEVVPATGRGFCRLREDVIGVGGIRYVISGNGAVVTDGNTGLHLTEHLIPCRAAASLADELLALRACVYVHQNDGKSTHIAACRDAEVLDHCRREREKGQPDAAPVLKDGLGDFILNAGQDVVKLGAVFWRFDGFSTLLERLETDYSDIRGFRVDSSSMEFVSRRAGKETALLELCRHLRIAPEQVCAFGDYENDIGMLRMAGIGVAMGNAAETVKQAADTVTKSNDDDGIAEFCETYILTEREDKECGGM